MLEHLYMDTEKVVAIRSFVFNTFPREAEGSVSHGLNWEIRKMIWCTVCSYCANHLTFTSLFNVDAE